MVRESFDTTGDEQEMDDMTTGTTAPVPPFGGTQSLAGSPTYDVYANTQMGRLSRIVALHAGVSEPSTSRMLAERLAESTRKALETDSRLASIEVIGLRPLVKDIALASYSGLFKSAMDVLPAGTLEGVPVLLGATAGTARHSLVTEMALRPLVAYMKALPTRTAVFAASEDFGAAWQTPSSSERPESPLNERVARAGRELATLMERFPRQAPVDPLADFAPMGALLAGR